MNECQANHPSYHLTPYITQAKPGQTQPNRPGRFTQQQIRDGLPSVTLAHHWSNDWAVRAQKPEWFTHMWSLKIFSTPSIRPGGVIKWHQLSFSFCKIQTIELISMGRYPPGLPRGVKQMIERDADSRNSNPRGNDSGIDPWTVSRIFTAFGYSPVVKSSPLSMGLCSDMYWHRDHHINTFYAGMMQISCFTLYVVNYDLVTIMRYFVTGRKRSNVLTLYEKYNER